MKAAGTPATGRAGTRIAAMPDGHDVPLLAWGEHARSRQAERRPLRLRLVLGAFGIALLGVTAIDPPAPRLVWNASASAPRGLYRVSPGARFAVGDMVIARTPMPWRALAARRHYLPANVPLVKRVAAVGGDRVCARARTITINGMAAATRRLRDAKRRPLPWWEGCRRLGEGEAFLLMTGEGNSFDGRYFGPTEAGDILGRAWLLWPR